MNDMKQEGNTKIETVEEVEDKWAADVWTYANATLLPRTKSVSLPALLPQETTPDRKQWYMGDNIPGKPREPLLYMGGTDKYHRIIKETAQQGYTGFVRS